VQVNRRRFAVLATVLVTVNVFFWLAQSGLALPGTGIIQSLLGGGSMIRAEIVWQAPDGTIEDTQLYRGVITAVSPTSITLKEKDRSDTIPLATTVSVQGRLRPQSVAVLRRGLRVVVARPANGPADTIQIEGFGQ
jgi:hypothetical protein